MRELDENYVYDLSELTNNEKSQLLDRLIELDKSWTVEASRLQLFSNKYLYFSNSYNSLGEWLVSREMYFTTREIVNAKELFYTLENIQVDCSDLTEEQIKEMCKVFESNGYKIWDDEEALKIQGKFVYLRLGFHKEFYITGEWDTKTTITYEKFMELFSRKEENFKKLVEVLNEELMEESQPHYDNTNGSIYKFCNDQKLNSWEFDIIKRVVRCRKKGLFREDLEKTKYLIDLYLKEFECGK